MEPWRPFDEDDDGTSWHALTTRSARDPGELSWEPRGTLSSQIAYHLLLALLTPEQRLSVQSRGWFEVPWPEQVLVLRVHVERIPTVDAFQAYPAGSDTQPAVARVVEGRAGGGKKGQKGPLLPGVYLCSWDVRDSRAVRRRGSAERTLRVSPVTLAKRLVVAQRRGALRELLEGSETILLGQLVGRTGDMVGR